MKISELQELLEKAKEEYGDVNIGVEHNERREYFDIDDYLGGTFLRSAGGYIPLIQIS